MRLAWILVAACGRIDFDPLPTVAPADSPQLGLGAAHACLRRDDGTLWCWGRNMTGELGLGAALHGVNQTRPVQVAPATTWTDVAPGTAHTCALDDQGRAWCWGANNLGQLGIAPATCGNAVVDPGETCDDGNNANNDGCNCLCQTTPAIADDVSAPVLVTGTQVYRRIFSGGDFSCAIATDGSLWCWGDNGHGELGLGDTKMRSFPRQIGSATSWTTLALGTRDLCGIQDDKSLWCVGNNMFGQLGASTTSLQLALVAPGSRWAAIDAGGDFTCGIGDDQRLYCLGRNDVGQLGLGDLMQRSMPTINANRDFDRVAAGNQHACARSDDGSLWCWGHNDTGEVGIGTVDPTNPAGISRVAGTWTAVRAGTGFTCALDTALAVWCWGNGNSGRLGTGSQANTPQPVRLDSL